MPKWSGYHVKSDGRAYFRPYIPNDLKAILGTYPMVNLGMKASKQAERLALMHFIAFEGVIEDKRREIAEEARTPRKRSLSEYTEAEVQAFAVETAQGLNREQHADIPLEQVRMALTVESPLVETVVNAFAVFPLLLLPYVLAKPKDWFEATLAAGPVHVTSSSLSVIVPEPPPFPSSSP